jgi:pyrimidine-nucleoside phosphorylase
MVAIGKLSGRKVVALLSDMNQPLGNAVGNALEVKEAISTLQGKGPADFVEHCLTVGAHMLVIGEKAKTLHEGRKLVTAALKEGRGLRKLRELVENQGGDPSYIDDPSRFKIAPVIAEIKSPKTGYLAKINAQEIGEASVEMGAGRVKKEDTIDHAVGIIVHHKVGDKVGKGDVLFTLHAKDSASMNRAQERVLSACKFTSKVCEPLPLFYEVIS